MTHVQADKITTRHVKRPSDELESLARDAKRMGIGTLGKHVQQVEIEKSDESERPLPASITLPPTNPLAGDIVDGEKNLPIGRLGRVEPREGAAGDEVRREGNIIGVSQLADDKCAAHIVADGVLAPVKTVLGVFGSELEAACKHDEHSARYGSRLNFSVKERPVTKDTSKKGRVPSKYVGVSWNRKNQKWVVQICIEGKQTYLGSFANEEEAARKYDDFAIKSGRGRRTNFPLRHEETKALPESPDFAAANSAITMMAMALHHQYMLRQPFLYMPPQQAGFQAPFGGAGGGQPFPGFVCPPNTTMPGGPAVSLNMANFEAIGPRGMASFGGMDPQGTGPQSMGPQGMGPQGMGPQGMDPQGMGPQGMGPQGMGPQGMGPQGMGPQGMVKMGGGYSGVINMRSTNFQSTKQACVDGDGSMAQQQQGHPEGLQQHEGHQQEIV